MFPLAGAEMEAWRRCTGIPGQPEVRALPCLLTLQS